MKLIEYKEPRIIAGDLVSTEVVLSKRNILALLTKLFISWSACTICSNHVVDEHGKHKAAVFAVRVEPDDKHYSDESRGGTSAGRMHVDTERVLKVIKEAVGDGD